MNIHVSDLRKGNLILTEHGVMPVHHIVFDDIYVQGIDGRVLFARQVEGVETSHTLMIQYGFKLYDDNGEIKGNDRFYSRPGLKGCFTLPNYRYSLNDNTYPYFHELQNVTYWLTKQELKINL